MKKFLEKLYKCFNQKQSKEDFFINFAVFMSIGFIFDILIKILFMNTVLENTGIVIYLNILCMLIEYYKCKYLGKSKLKFFIKVLLSLVITVLFMIIK